nr:hypothetical protein [Tanacetum cinerariifolium]
MDLATAARVSCGRGWDLGGKSGWEVVRVSMFGRLDDDENPSFTLKEYEEEEQDEECVLTPKKDKSNDEEKMYGEEDDDVAKELYGDLNITQGLKDADMPKVEQGGAYQHNASHESGFVHEEEDTHVTLTTIHDKTEGPLQSSSISSDFASKLLNFDNTGQDVNEIASLMNTSTVPPPPPLVNPSPHLTTITPQPTPDSTTTTTNITMLCQKFLTLHPYSSLIKGCIVDNYLASKLKEEVNVVAIIKEQVKAQVSKFMPQIEKYVTEYLGAKVLVRSTNQPQTYYAVAASLSKFKLKKILIDKMETNESINRSNIQRNLYNALVESYNTDEDIQEQEFEAADTKIQQDQGNESGHIDDQPNNEGAPTHDWFQKYDKPLTPDRPWNKSKYVDFRRPQKWICTIAKECYKARQPPRTFDELMGTPINFSSYVMNHLKIENLTQEILVGPAFNLLKDSCRSFVELEYHFKECYKAVTDKLDWNKPEGHAYPFDLSKPLPFIEDQ